MSDFSAPFVVEASVRLPGLGLLVLPAAPAPDWLATQDLHTALAIVLPASVESAQAIIGTVEEISQAGRLEQRALLLDFDPDTLPAPGTHLKASLATPDLI